MRSQGCTPTLFTSLAEANGLEQLVHPREVLLSILGEVVDVDALGADISPTIMRGLRETWESWKII